MSVLAGPPSPTQIGLSRNIIRSFQDDLLESYSDADLARHVFESPRLTSLSSIHLLSTKYVAKVYQPHQVEDMVRAVEVARQLGIHVPSFKRITEFDDVVFCIMERIPGPTLEEAWAKLGWMTCIPLALHLRHTIRLLRSVTSCTAGSLATGECKSFWLEDRFGVPANASAEDISSFIRFWAAFTSLGRAIKTATAQGVGAWKGYMPITARTFVFTHHDLAPRNIILDSSGRLCLIDWDYAGFYPRYFEYAAMHNFRPPEDWNWSARMRWLLFTWIAVGRSEKERCLLERIRSRFTRFRVGRRFHIMANGIPTGSPVF